MKALKIFLTGIVLFLLSALQAQVIVNLNNGSPPPWGPAGYSGVRYYYLPDVEAYYDVQSSQFIYYNSKGVWIHRSSLPSRHRNYDLYNGYKVVMADYRGNSPYVHFADYKTKYAKDYRGQPQKNIGEKPGKRNSGANTPTKVSSNKKVSQVKNKSEGQGKDKNIKRNNSRGGGNGKKN